MPDLDFAGGFFEVLFDVAVILFALFSAAHALLVKRDPRAALGWIAVCLVFPLYGAVLYWLFGVNRIRTRGKKMRRQWPVGEEPDAPRRPSAILPARLAEYARVSDKITRRPLQPGNHVEPFHNGEGAYPVMLEAIRGAHRSISLCTYIFESDATGLEFVEALAEAAGRGVDVKVLVDAVGERYGGARISRILHGRGVRVARFLPGFLISPGLHMNLRNHRKVLVVDGALAFTGGMNLGGRHMAEAPANKHRTVDLHFRVTGPVVAELEEVFLEDWSFTTEETEVRGLIPELPLAGKMPCRAISDGPNEDFEKLQWILLGAISAARKSIRIMTPYFVPDREIVAALSTADLRGVEVQIIVPKKNNLPFVDWAARSVFWQLLKRGVEVFYQPGPFVHTKLFIVDDCYTLVGSANLDARSLRLNFELNVEVYDSGFAATMSQHFVDCRERSSRLTLDDLSARPLLIRMRDSFARLFGPYL